MIKIIDGLVCAANQVHLDILIIYQIKTLAYNAIGLTFTIAGQAIGINNTLGYTSIDTQEEKDTIITE